MHKIHLLGTGNLLDVIGGSWERLWCLITALGAPGSALGPWHGDVVALFTGLYDDSCNAEVPLNEL